MTNCISFAAYSGVGKTTIIKEVIKHLKLKGYKVGVIKHDVHDFQIDHEGKDTWTHYNAGADMVSISNAKKFALIERVEKELTLDEILENYKEMDIVIVEGFKNSDKPKIEITRKEKYTGLISPREKLAAIVSDTHYDLDVPQFSLDDYRGIAEFIERNIICSHV